MQINLKRVVIMTTFRCNLTCKGCLVGANVYKTQEPDLPVKTAIRTFEKLFQIVDFVDWLELTGGEALLNKELSEIVNEALKYADKFNELRIYTNGTVEFSSEITQLLAQRNDKLLVHIADYGVNAVRTEENIAWLKENNVRYVYKRYVDDDQYSGGWVDFGNYKFMNRMDEELKEIFDNCGQKKMHGCYPIWNGQMHYCAYALRGVEQGLVPAVQDVDYIDLFSERKTVDELKVLLIQYSNRPYFSACNYCTGDFGTTDTSKRFSAGVQK